MIQLSLLPATPQAPVRPALLASEGVSSFALALGALASRMRVPAADAASVAFVDRAGEIPLPGRQMPAEGGKDLPAPLAGDEEAEDTDEDGADVPFAWFAVAPPPVSAPAEPFAARAATVARVVLSNTDAPTMAPPAAPDATREWPAAVPQQQRGETAAIVVPAGEVSPLSAAVKLPLSPSGISAEGAERLDAPGSHSDVAGPVAPHPDPQIATEPKPTASAAAAGRSARPPEPGTSAEVPARPAEIMVQPAQAPSPEANKAPAVRVPDQARATTTPAPIIIPLPANPPVPPFAALIAGADPVAPTWLRRAPSIEPMVAGGQLPTIDSVQHAVSAAADIQQGALDTRRQEWVGKMVEHIEALRDAAPVRETRLSLVPEALGKVEVSIRHDGDRVHVHFATETPAARQLIADAQPRLGELAEARGLKLGQTSFESGTAGQGPNRESRDQPVPQQALRPRPGTDPAVGTPDDDRIA